jgi:hypothetical protein
MEARLIEQHGIRIVHVSAVATPVRSRQDALDLMLGHGHRDLDGLAVDAACLHPDFLVLRTGVAGELLQMFVNYHLPLAIIGDFPAIASGPLRDFIVESNRGNQVGFVADLDAALARLLPPG